MTNANVGLTISADASDFQRQLALVNKELERVTNTLKQPRGAKDMLGLQNAERDLRAINASVASLTREYASATREIERLEAQHQRLRREGKEISDAEQARLRTMREQSKELRYQLTDTRSMYGDAAGQIQARRVTVDEARGADESRRNRIRAAEQRINRAGSASAQLAMGQGQILTTALSSIPVVGGLLGAIAGFGMSAYAQGRGTLIQNVLSQSAAGGVLGTNQGLGRMGGMGMRHAYSRAETLQMLQQHATATGGQTGGFDTALAMQRGFSLPPATLNSLLQASRGAGGEMGGEKRILEALVNAIQSGTFTQAMAGELAQAATGIVQERTSAGLNTDASMILGLLTGLGRSMGGGYEQSPQRTGALFSRLDSSIRGGMGADENRKAFLYQAISTARPNLDHIGIMKQMERGATPENLRAISGYSREFMGTDKQGTRHLPLLYKELFNLPSIAEAQRLADSNALDTASGDLTGDAQGAIGTQAKRAQRGLAPYQRQLQMAEERANLALKADPVMERIETLQTRQIERLGEVAGKLDNIFTGKDGGILGVAKEGVEQIVNMFGDALRSVLPAPLRGMVGTRKVGEAKRTPPKSL